MTNGFQQQAPIRNIFTRSAPEAQHGKKTEALVEPSSFSERPRRTPTPRPGHV